MHGSCARTPDSGPTPGHPTTPVARPRGRAERRLSRAATQRRPLSMQLRLGRVPRSHVRAAAGCAAPAGSASSAPARLTAACLTRSTVWHCHVQLRPRPLHSRTARAMAGVLRRTPQRSAAATSGRRLRPRHCTGCDFPLLYTSAPAAAAPSLPLPAPSLPLPAS